jgi:hypothetical protein
MMEDGSRFRSCVNGVWLLDVSRGAMWRIIDDASAEEFAWAPWQDVARRGIE